jgi:hypothetical protein
MLNIIMLSVVLLSVVLLNVAGLQMCATVTDTLATTSSA